MRRIFFGPVIFLLLMSAQLAAQQPARKKVSTKDSLDGAFDLSDYVTEAHGFIPVPIIITEPALGGFGGGFVPIFIKKRPHYADSVRGTMRMTRVAPDIMGGAALYTLNGTWLTAGFRSGTLIKSRIKYVVGAAYGNINLAFYRDIAREGEKKFNFNFRTLPIFLQGIRRIAYSHWYAGIKYLFLKTDLHYEGSEPPSFVKPIEQSSIVSQLGAVVELDTRDNIFTPDKGLKVHVDGNRSDNIIGSDYSYWRINYYMYAYKELTPNWIGGWRVDGQQSFGDPPFYLLPYISMRGVPAVKYQGNAVILTELESRWDVVPRWSLVSFGGSGKAFNDWSDFGSASWIFSYGAGFRYLLARKFGARIGIDLAHGPGTWAYYIVFGSNWLK
jgi:hypothetical protein